MRFILAGVLLAAAFLGSACNSTIIGVNGTSEADLPEADLSFANDIFPILTSSCSGYGCHIGSKQSGVSMSSYSALMASVGQKYRTKVVIAGDAEQSPLVDVLTSGSRLGQRMPPGSSLSTAQITAIRTWIDEGAKNN